MTMMTLELIPSLYTSSQWKYIEPRLIYMAKEVADASAISSRRQRGGRRSFFRQFWLQGRTRGEKTNDRIVITAISK
ncbi:hypothetical protein TNCV_125791 [Trichonephila clavipes]|nr:hypothetical protein TNCV_125791 [Trichonephila clavipes]